MKRLALTILLTSSLAVGNDKLAHASLGATATLAVYLGFKNLGVEKNAALILSAVIVNSIGVIKEASDSKFDSNDIAANLLGTATVVIPLSVFDK